MWIYKIYNDINDKVYIGQTIHSVQRRFSRHLQDAISGRLNTHLCRAIRLYGKKHFFVETIDTASNQEELTKKEYYWINFYNSVNKGYNETANQKKCGGNTYQNKTAEEMNIIKAKIKKAKLGDKNPNHRKVIQTDLKTGKKIVFGSMQEGARWHEVANKNFIAKRCNGTIKFPYHNRYIFEDYNEPVSTIPDECKEVE